MKHFCFCLCKKLRSTSIFYDFFFSSEEHSRLEEQKKFLEQEMEKVLEQRAQIEQLEQVRHTWPPSWFRNIRCEFVTQSCFVESQELRNREEIVQKKETMLAEKSELEIKKLRSSQILSKVKTYTSYKSREFGQLL